MGISQPNFGRSQGQASQSDAQPHFAADFNYYQPPQGATGDIPQWNMSAPDQSLLNSGQTSLPGPLSWNWQDMIAGIPPAFDFGAYEFDAPLEEL